MYLVMEWFRDYLLCPELTHLWLGESCFGCAEWYSLDGDSARTGKPAHYGLERLHQGCTVCMGLFRGILLCFGLTYPLAHRANCVQHRLCSGPPGARKDVHRDKFVKGPSDRF